MYLILGGVILIAGSILSIFLIKRIKAKKERSELITTIKENHPELLVEKGFEESATKIVKTFLWYMESPQSPYNRTQRRRIKRHWKKFLFAWPDLSKKQQDVNKIIEFLIKLPINDNAVNRYKSAHVGFPTSKKPINHE